MKDSDIAKMCNASPPGAFRRWHAERKRRVDNLFAYTALGLLAWAILSVIF